MRSKLVPTIVVQPAADGELEGSFEALMDMIAGTLAERTCDQLEVELNGSSTAPPERSRDAITTTASDPFAELWS